MIKINLLGNKKQLLDVGRGSYLLNKILHQKKILMTEPPTKYDQTQSYKYTYYNLNYIPV
jgi:hypothetical protein